MVAQRHSNTTTIKIDKPPWPYRCDDCALPTRIYYKQAIQRTMLFRITFTFLKPISSALSFHVHPKCYDKYSQWIYGRITWGRILIEMIWCSVIAVAMHVLRIHAWRSRWWEWSVLWVMPKFRCKLMYARKRTTECRKIHFDNSTISIQLKS